MPLKSSLLCHLPLHAAVLLGCLALHPTGHAHASPGQWTTLATQAMAQAGDNRGELEAAVDQCPAAQRDAMEFLIAFMPQRDLDSLTAKFLLQNHRLAHEALEAAPWRKEISEDMFLNYILPYANINERRDAWRAKFRKEFLPMVARAKTPGEAATILNREIFPLLKVKYSTKRKRADQAPLDSIESGLASCTGLSILLIDACRAVGVPARFAGTPLWSDRSGNHSWVEVWDNGWHFTGAAEPQDKLDRVWFLGRASKAQRDHRLHAIYAVRYQKTPISFPLVWDPRIQYVHAVNVTDRYTSRAVELPEGHIEVRCCCVGKDGQRLAASLKVLDENGKPVFAGTTKDERFDRNDHVTIVLPKGKTFTLRADVEGKASSMKKLAVGNESLVTLQIDESANAPAAPGKPKASHKESLGASLTPLQELLDDPQVSLEQVAKQKFAKHPLSKAEADAAIALLWDHRKTQIAKEAKADIEAKAVTMGDKKMPFFFKVFGDAPTEGRSLYISMHGGGGAPARVNDSQWENQKRLYQLKEGVYLAPRAPTNTWNLWHQGHIDPLFRRLIRNFVVTHNVNPDRVYLMGYSAGGDGVYQLAPRIADSLAAAAMMAGHPNETSPLGLRNLPFTLHMGGRDGAYNRNKTAKDWEQKLAALQKEDPKGYVHWVKIYPNKGHWMDREDAAALPWMHKHNRNVRPTSVVWKQDDVTHSRFYWLSVPTDQIKARSEVRATREGQTIQVSSPSGDVKQVAIRLDDTMLDLEQPVVIAVGEKRLRQKAKRTLRVIAQTMAERDDPKAVFTAEIKATLP